MGSGKSSLGKKLAGKLSMQFYDLDKIIENKSGHNVSEIFKLFGEDYFRELERKCLTEVILQDDFVLATGGGTPCYFDNMELINRVGISVYLDMDNKSLFNRLKSSKKIRPLIFGMTDKDLEDYIENTLHIRRFNYESANIKINALSPDIIELKAKILKF